MVQQNASFEVGFIVFFDLGRLFEALCADLEEHLKESTMRGTRRKAWTIFRMPRHGVHAC